MERKSQMHSDGSPERAAGEGAGEDKSGDKFIHHDLLGCVSSLNWIIATLNSRLNGRADTENLAAHLNNTMMRLNGLVDELAETRKRNRLQVDSGAGGTATSAAGTDLRKVVHESVAMLLSLAMQRGIGIDLNLPSEPVTVAAASLDVSRLVDNLVRNAIMHNAAETIVRVTLFAQDCQCVLMIEDDGLGIDEKRLELICGEPVGDARVITSSLGLSIVRELVAKTGARIAGQSKPGCGTSFKLTWPRVGSEDRTGRHTKARRGENPGAGNGGGGYRTDHRGRLLFKVS